MSSSIIYLFVYMCGCLWLNVTKYRPKLRTLGFIQNLALFKTMKNVVIKVVRILSREDQCAKGLFYYVAPIIVLLSLSSERCQFDNLCCGNLWDKKNALLCKRALMVGDAISPWGDDAFKPEENIPFCQSKCILWHLRTATIRRKKKAQGHATPLHITFAVWTRFLKFLYELMSFCQHEVYCRSVCPCFSIDKCEKPLRNLFWKDEKSFCRASIYLLA